MEGAEFLHGGQHCRPGTPLCAAAGGDHFAVEDLLDFSNEEGEGGEWELDVCAAGNSTDESSTVTAVDCCSNSLSGCDPHFGSGDLAFKGFADAGLSGDLCGPHEELAELEWLSNFVEESFSSEDLHKPHLLSTTKPTASTSFAATKSELFAPTQLSLFRPEAAVPGKARSKRSRAAPCSWSSRLRLFSPFMSAASSPESELISLPTAAPVKKATELEKKPDLTPAAATATVAAPSERRRCLHCQVEKTPQWRAGPMGPKTLCNACGVRYKSGRLVPEYRPAASPTFIPAKHSNSHRKVLELRRQKDLQRQHQLRSDGVVALYSPEATAAAEPSGDGLLFRQMGPGFRHLM